MKRPITLRDIPRIIFREFSISDEPQDKTNFNQTGAEVSVSICAAQEPGPRGPLTLLLNDFVCQYKRHHRVSLDVLYARPKIADYHPAYQGFPPPTPLLKIFFKADDPPYDPHDARWENGKGYWVDEYLRADYPMSSRGEIVTPYDDWKFGFLLRIQARAYNLAKEVSSRGHWQCEWNPAENYSKKWNVPFH